MCGQLATEVVRSDRPTPPIDTDSIERLATWRASACGVPPDGEGTVVAMCQAKVKGGGHVLYWKSRNKDKVVDGLLTCQ